MNGLIPIERLTPQPVAAELLALNETTWERGLTLTEEEARELSETRILALRENDRIEFGTEVMRKIMDRFADSRYIGRSDWADVLNLITYYFYYIKAETDDRIGDGALVEEMFLRFELYCRGDLDLFEQKEVERIIRKINMGTAYERWYGDEELLDPVNFGRGTPENLLDETYTDRSEDADDYEGGTADEIARDETVGMDDFSPGDEDEFSSGYENAEDESLYDEVADEAIEEDAPDHPLNRTAGTGGSGSGSSVRRSLADRGYFSLRRLTGRSSPEDAPDEDDGGSLELPGGASLSVGDAYGADFEGFSEDEEAFMSSFMDEDEDAGDEDLTDLDELDDFLDQIARGEAGNGGDCHE